MAIKFILNYDERRNQMKDEIIRQVLNEINDRFKTHFDKLKEDFERDVKFASSDERRKVIIEEYVDKILERGEYGY